MHNVLKEMNEMEKNKIDLKHEFQLALKDETFKMIVDKLKFDEKKIINYTSLLEESSLEYKNCSNCKHLCDCKNKVSGYAYLPRVLGGELIFEYKPCRFKTREIKNNSYLKNVTYLNVPLNNTSASISKIYKTDKNRFEVINYLLDFLDRYETEKNQKGLYLHGNFGCGKTYLISAIFNELAKSNHKSMVIFWPEFLRLAFNEDFNKLFETVKNTPLLLIDDIGAENNNTWNRDEILCPLLQYRMDNHLTTFFTSNLTIEELEQHLSTSKQGVEEVKARRIISRIKQLTDDLEMISKNLRN